MNPHRDESWRCLRDGQDDEISEERLTEIIKMLQCVASNTNTEHDQVINVYNAATRNRLTEVILDSGDAFDSLVDEFKEWHKKDGYMKLKLAGDYMCDEVRVKMINDD